MLTEEQIKQRNREKSNELPSLGELVFLTVPGSSLFGLGKRIGEMEANNERKPPVGERVAAYCYAFALDAVKTYFWYGAGKVAYSLIEQLF